MAESTPWDVTLTLVCDNNAHALRLREIARERGIPTRTGLDLGAGEVTVMLHADLEIEGPDETEVERIVREANAALIDAATDSDIEIVRGSVDLLADDEDDESYSPDELQQAFQDMGPELADMARDRGWLPAPDADPLPALSRTQTVVSLFAAAIEADEILNKQWLVWEIARELGVDSEVREVFGARGMGPVDFDSTDFRGLQP